MIKNFKDYLIESKDTNLYSFSVDDYESGDEQDFIPILKRCGATNVKFKSSEDGDYHHIFFNVSDGTSIEEINANFIEIFNRKFGYGEEIYRKDDKLFHKVDTPSSPKRSYINNNGYEYVDLDLPSGTLWAKYNVGAKKLIECGGYYQWGGLVDMTNKTSNFEVYPFGNDMHDLTKYNGYDGRKILELKDDVAHQTMGGGWHMPTVEQLEELMDETIQKNVYFESTPNIYLVKFISKKDNSKHMYVPCSGEKYDNKIYSEKNMFLWSNTSYGKIPHRAYCLHRFVGRGDKDNAMPVRGVID